MSAQKVETRVVTVTASGTRVPAKSVDFFVDAVLIQASNGNVQGLWVGDNTVENGVVGIELNPGDIKIIEGSQLRGHHEQINLKNLFFDSDLNGAEAQLEYLVKDK